MSKPAKFPDQQGSTKGSRGRFSARPEDDGFRALLAGVTPDHGPAADLGFLVERLTTK